MSLKGSINRGEKWLKIYSDKEIEKNPVYIEDVKNYKEAMEKGGIEEKPLKDMDLVELNKYIYQKALDFGDDEPSINKVDLIKQIKKAEKAKEE